MERLEGAALERARAALRRWEGRTAYVHLETTQGAYARHHRGEAHPVGGLVQNARVVIERASLLGPGPHRLGLVTVDGYALVEGLTHWEEAGGGPDGRPEDVLAFYALLADGKLAAAFILSTAPRALAGRAFGGTEVLDLATDAEASENPAPFGGTGSVPDAGSGSSPLGPPGATVLSIFPHPDDETFAAGATLARWAASGARVVAVTLTLGELGRSLGDPPFATRLTLPDVRRQELAAALRALGVERIVLMHLHDKTVEFVDREALVRRLLETIETYRPQTIVTYYPGYAVHPDHDATGEAVAAAVARLPRDRRPAVYGAAFAPGRERLGPPDFVVEAGAFWPKKLAALRTHASQTGALFREYEALLAAGDQAAEAAFLARFREERFWRVDVEAAGTGSGR